MGEEMKASCHFIHQMASRDPPLANMSKHHLPMSPDHNNIHHTSSTFRSLFVVCTGARPHDDARRSTAGIAFAHHSLQTVISLRGSTVWGHNTASHFKMSWRVHM